MVRVVISAFAGLLLVLIFSTCDADQSNQAAERSDKDIYQELSRQFPLWMEQYDVPGAAIAIISNSEPIWSDAYGYASVKEQIPMTTQTVCRVESISKSVTARGVMKLAASEKINLDDAVTEHITSWQFPETDYDVEQITTRHLLSHTSGLALGSLGLEYPPGADKPSLTESLSKEVIFIQEPGKEFHYSNIGYHLLELVIEEVSEQPFSEFMYEEVLLPSGMNESDFTWNDDFITPVADGHELNGQPVPVYVYSEKAAGGLFTNVMDIARFVSSGMITESGTETSRLTKSSTRELYKPVIRTSGIYSLVSDYYGMGHFIETLSTGEIAVFGGGQGHGWMTHFHMVPEQGAGIVILTNSSRSWPLISKTLSVWTERNGFGAAGMERIAGAINVIWTTIALILTGCFWITARIIKDVRSGRRKLMFPFRNAGWITYGNLLLMVLLSALLIWVHTREYLFLTSVFPQAGSWLIAALWVVFGTMLLPLALKKAEPAGSEESASQTSRELI